MVSWIGNIRNIKVDVAVIAELLAIMALIHE